MVVLHHVCKGPLRGTERAAVPLTQRAASELAVAAVLAPLAETNLRAKVFPGLWAVDASPSHGAFTLAQVDQPAAAACWSSGERRGLYSRLEDPARARLRCWNLSPHGGGTGRF